MKKRQIMIFNKSTSIESEAIISKEKKIEAKFLLLSSY